MNWITLFFFSALLAYSSSKEIESNDISSPTPPTNLDSTLRKALLRALTELENEDSDKDEGSSRTVFVSTTDRNQDKIVEKASASAINVITTDENDTENVTPSSTTTTPKPIVVVQRSSGYQHKPIIHVRKEEFVTSATNNFNDVNYNSVTINDKRFTSGHKTVSILPKVSTTTPIPTSTEESEAKAEDVQFFSAPLVAAFTVHQDERGQPKKVEPIFKVPGQTAVTSRQLEQQKLLKQERFKNQFAIQEKQRALEAQVYNLQQQQQYQQQYLAKQQELLIQNQRILEEQRRLRQNDLPFVPIIQGSNQLKSNQFQSSQNSFNQFRSVSQDGGSQNQFGFQNTNNFQNQNPVNQFQNSNQVQIQNSISPFQNNNQLQNSNPKSINQFQNNNQFINSANSNQFQTNQFQGVSQLGFNNQFQSNQNPSNINSNSLSANLQLPNQFVTSKFQKQGNTAVAIQPSLSSNPALENSGGLPLNAQILPIRNAIDFHHIPTYHTINTQTAPVQSFNTFQSFPQNLQTRQSNRVFRHEPATGNFGFNNVQQQPTRFFRSNVDTFQPHVNQQLNNLLYHSGITRNVRQNEDLSIVSKVLSYNVGRDSFYTPQRGIH